MIKEPLGGYTNIQSGIGRKEYAFNPKQPKPFVLTKKAQNIPRVYFDDNLTIPIVEQLATDTFANQIKENFENIGYTPKVSVVRSLHTNGIKKSGFENLTSVATPYSIGAKQTIPIKSFFEISQKRNLSIDGYMSSKKFKQSLFEIPVKRRIAMKEDMFSKKFKQSLFEIPVKRRIAMKEDMPPKRYKKDKSSVFITPQKRRIATKEDTASKKFKKDFIYRETTSRTIGTQEDLPVDIKRGRRPKAVRNNPSFVDEKGTQTE